MYIKKIIKKTESKILHVRNLNYLQTKKKKHIPHVLEDLNPYAIDVFQFDPVTVSIQLIDYNDEVVHDVAMIVTDHKDQHLNTPNDFVVEVDFVLHDEMVVENMVAENQIELIDVYALVVLVHVYHYVHLNDHLVVHHDWNDFLCVLYMQDYCLKDLFLHDR